MSNANLIKPNSEFSFTVTENDANQRLDKFISQQFPLYSRSFFQYLIQQGQVSINEKQIKKPGTSLKENDVITITFPEKKEIDKKEVLEEITGVEVIHEDPHFLILYKPAGIVVHKTSDKSTELSLVDWVLLHYKDIEGVGYIDRPGIVHRLDKNTSGLLIIPRTNFAHTTFGDMFRDRAIKKTYYAIVKGHPEQFGTIDFPIGRDPHNPTKMKAFLKAEAAYSSKKIRESVTHYKVKEYFDDAALVEINLETGRTHQIRVHFKAIGHPLIGDTTYGKESKKIKRQALHAQSLAFNFDNKNYQFSKDLPEDMKKLLKNLKK